MDANRDINALVYALSNNQRYGGAASTGRVTFMESHDVVGDLNGGTRLVTAIDPVTPNSYRARKLSFLATALTFTAPGVPMLFQGQEMLENQQFSSGRPVDWTKTNTYSAIVKCYHDLIGQRRNYDGGVPGLQGSQISFLKVDTGNQLIAYRRWAGSNSNQDAIVIGNLAGVTRTNYALSFPRPGTWYVHFNSDSTNYSSDYGNIGPSQVTATGSSATAAVTIAPYSLLILSQTPPSPALSLAVSNKAGIISWPATYFGWTLETATNLNGAAGWSAISASTYQTNTSAISVSVTPSNWSAYFRLHKI